MAEEFRYGQFKQLEFWIERAAVLLVVLCYVPSNVWIFLSPAYSLLILSNFFYMFSYVNSQVIRAKPHPPSVAGDNKCQRRGRELMKQVFWVERLAAFFVFLCWVSSHEPSRACFWWFAVLLFSVTNVLYIIYYLCPKDLKKEVKAREERNKIDKESEEESDETDEESEEESDETDEESEEESDETEEESEEEETSSCDSSEEFHAWEEERSQLMYELGAARASLEIYRELLHDLHYLQPKGVFH